MTRWARTAFSAVSAVWVSSHCIAYAAPSKSKKREDDKKNRESSLGQKFRVPMGISHFDLKSVDPNGTAGLTKEDALETVKKDQSRLEQLQEYFFADGSKRILVVLMAMDTGGKEAVIRHLMRNVHPQGIKVKSFSRPTAEEASHHFLWRIWNALLPPGTIQVFNRSHYEDITVPSVHHNYPDYEIEARYKAINEFERELTREGWTIIKIFLHISKDEQKKRLQERLNDPAKQWKFTSFHQASRKLWNEYEAAFERVFTLTNTPWAPWYIIPANNKWLRDAAVGNILLEHMEALDLRPPAPANLANIILDDAPAFNGKDR